MERRKTTWDDVSCRQKQQKWATSDHDEWMDGLGMARHGLENKSKLKYTDTCKILKLAVGYMSINNLIYWELSWAEFLFVSIGCYFLLFDYWFHLAPHAFHLVELWRPSDRRPGIGNCCWNVFLCYALGLIKLRTHGPIGIVIQFLHCSVLHIHSSLLWSLQQRQRYGNSNWKIHPSHCFK